VTAATAPDLDGSPDLGDLLYGWDRGCDPYVVLNCLHEGEPFDASPGARGGLQLAMAIDLQRYTDAVQLCLLADLAVPGRAGDPTRLVEAALSEQHLEPDTPDDVVEAIRADLLEEQAQRLAAAEVANRLGLTAGQARNRVADAVDLCRNLPRVVVALREGRISLELALIIAHRTAVLTLPLRRRVAELAVRSAAVPGVTARKFKSVVDTLVVAVDPEAAEARRRQAIKGRHVSVRDVGDGMSVFTATIPSEDAEIVMAVLRHLAAITDPADLGFAVRNDPEHGAGRTGAQRCADGFVDILTLLFAGGTVSLRPATARADAGAGAPAGTHTSADAGAETACATAHAADSGDVGAGNQSDTATPTADTDTAESATADTDADAAEVAAAESAGSAGSAAAGAADAGAADAGETATAAACPADTNASKPVAPDDSAATKAEPRTGGGASAAGAAPSGGGASSGEGAPRTGGGASAAGAAPSGGGASSDGGAVLDGASHTCCACCAPEATAASGLSGFTLGTRQGRSAHLVITVSAETLAGLSDDPGLLADHGVMTAQWCRQIATAAKSFTVVAVDSRGRPVDCSPTLYRPRQTVRDRVITLNPTCVFPGCAVPARRCDLDHIDAFDHRHPESGGRTRPDNLAPLCRQHHRLKTFGGWSYHRAHDTFVWVSPLGMTVRRPVTPLLPTVDPPDASDDSEPTTDHGNSWAPPGLAPPSWAPPPF
jgi:hypothetical protein